MSSKTKTGLVESTPTKASPATPRVSKLSRGVPKSEPNSPSPLQRGRLSIDRSPQTANSKATVDRRPLQVGTPSKVATPPEKPQNRAVKGSELQAQLSLVQEDLKKAKEQIELLEKDKGQALDELKQAQKIAEEANGKLQEALVAHKRAEENSEIEKFRAVELEQAGIEASQKKEEEWQKELEVVRNQHALDVSALLSTTEELQKLKHDWTMIIDAKNQALSHADDATKIAEIHAEKAEVLSAEIARLKALLDEKVPSEADESDKMVLKLSEEIDSLKQELPKAKCFEDKLVEREASIEQLNVELEAAKMAESYAHNLMEEWQSKVEELELRFDQAGKLERSASESLGSVMRQLEENNDLLHEAEAEIASLKEKMGLLEMTIGRQKGDLEESERRANKAKDDVSSMTKEIESLKAELEIVKDEKAQALDNEKLAASSVQSLLEEKNKLINELENARDEEEKSKKAMESLASALHEVSAEARDAKERLLSNQVEHESYESQIEDLRLVLKTTNERYESILDDAKHETDILRDSIEETKNEHEKLKIEWEQKERDMASSLKKSEEQSSSLENEIDRLVILLKHTEEEACTMREEEAHLKYNLKEVEAEVVSVQEALVEVKAENLKLKESLLDKETELQNVFEENEDIRVREAAALKKVEELSKLLEEATTKNEPKENGELTDSEKDYDLLPKVVEFSEENGHVKEEKAKPGLPPQQHKETKKDSSHEEYNGLDSRTAERDGVDIEILNGKPDKEHHKEQENNNVDVEFKMWESCTIEKKEYSPEGETEQEESFEEEVDPKAEGGESYDQINDLSSSENIDDGSTSPSNKHQQQHQKKKKPLLRKFGSLLKKKGSSSPKP